MAAADEKVEHDDVEGGQIEGAHLEDAHVEDDQLEDGHLEDGHLEDGHLEDGRASVVRVVPPGSLGELYRERYVPMVRLAYLMVGSTTVAEDLVQDSFARMHRHWDNCEHPRAYLRTAVVNACRSHLRRLALERAYRRHPSVVADGVLAEADELFDALAELPPRQRAALVLRFYEDLSEADIAVALGCRPGTVKSLLHRGLAELRKVVER